MVLITVPVLLSTSFFLALTVFYATNGWFNGLRLSVDYWTHYSSAMWNFLSVVPPLMVSGAGLFWIFSSDDLPTRGLRTGTIFVVTALWFGFCIVQIVISDYFGL